MRNKLFWIVAILAAVPAVCFFVVGICVVDKAPWFMAGFTYLVAVFTFLLWRATKDYAETTKEYTEVNKEYTEITRKLLKQSEKTLEQSKASFLVDIIDRTVEYLEKLPQHNKRAVQTSYTLNKARAFKRISEEISRQFLKAMLEVREFFLSWGSFFRLVLPQCLFVQSGKPRRFW